METSGGSRAWVLILEFVVALLVVAFLVVGPDGVDSARRRVHQLLQRSPAPPASPLPVTAQPATVRAQVPAQAPPAPAPARPTQRRGATLGTQTAPKTQPAPGTLPVSDPKVTRAPRPTPAAPRATQARPTLKTVTRPQPTPVPADATPPPLSPQQYLAKLLKEGTQLYQTGWYGPAMARFKEAVRVNPGSPTTHLWYGRAAYRAGRPTEARAALERAIALAPVSDAAREARALLDRMIARAE